MNPGFARVDDRFFDWCPRESTGVRRKFSLRKRLMNRLTIERRTFEHREFYERVEIQLYPDV